MPENPDPQPKNSEPGPGDRTAATEGPDAPATPDQPERAAAAASDPETTPDPEAVQNPAAARSSTGVQSPKAAREPLAVHDAAPLPGSAPGGWGDVKPTPGSPAGRTASSSAVGSQTPYAGYLAQRSAARPARLAPYPIAPVPQHVPSRAELVPLPAGLLAATVGTGVAAAVLVPVDRPGVGWLAAGLTVTGAVYAVDRAARRRVEASTRQRTASGSATSATSPAEQAVSGSDTAATSSVDRRDDAREGRFGERGGVTTAMRPVAEGATGSRRVPWGRIWWAALALALLGVGAVRDAGWLFALCAVGAVVAGSLAVVPRSVHGLWFDAVAVPFAAVISPPWLYRAMRRARGRMGGGSQRVWWSVAVAAGLLVIMVPLLSGADAVFAGLVDGLLPHIDVPAVVRWGVVFVVAGAGTAGALYLLAGPPPGHAEGEGDVEDRFAAVDGTDHDDAEDDDDAGGDEDEDHLTAGDPLGWMGIRRFSPLEWGIPVGALGIVFVAFVGTQIAVLFGGDGYVQRTAALTYAEYARGGFWQLSIVSMLTLAVIGAVLRFARQSSPDERRWLRVALAVVCGLTLVIVASALHRMWLYQQAYGFTVMRLLVEVFEGWIALVYVLVLASLVRLRRDWVPRAALGAAAVTLLGLAVLNPEGFVAERNIDRWQAGRSLDTDYLSKLSADVLPAADRLPDPQRAAIANVIRARLSDDPWQGWNYARATAGR